MFKGEIVTTMFPFYNAIFGIDNHDWVIAYFSKSKDTSSNAYLVFFSHEINKFKIEFLFKNILLKSTFWHQ